MSEQTKIQWATHTFNPWIGCTKVSPGCLNCYAEKTTLARVKRANGIEIWGKGAPRHRTSVATWNHVCTLDRKAAKAGERPRVFSSLCDPFDAEVSHDLRDEFFALLSLCVHMDFLLLSKRPDVMADYMAELYARKRKVFDAAVYRLGWGALACFALKDVFANPPLANLWLGVSVEDRARKSRIDELRKIPARVRFLSLEPLLEDLGTMDLEGIHWVIVGGESGAKARPCNVAWIRSIVRQCAAAGVACFVKQLGKNIVDRNDAGFDGDENEWPMDTRCRDLDQGYQGAPVQVLLKHPKGGDVNEWPEDLRVREFLKS